MSNLLSTLMDYAKQIPADVGRVATGIGTLGTSELARYNNQQLANQQFPSSIPPELVQQAQSLYQMGTPEAAHQANAIVAPANIQAVQKLPSEIALTGAQTANQYAEASKAPSTIGLSQAQADLARAQAGMANMQTGQGNAPISRPVNSVDEPGIIETRPAEVANAFGIKPEQMNPIQIRAQRYIDGLEDPSKVQRSDLGAVAALTLAKTIKPDLDPTVYKNRLMTAAAFSQEGKNGVAINNLNTAAGHLNELMNNYAALKNVSDKSSMNAAGRNAIGNYLTNIKHAEPLTNFNTTAENLSKEITNTYTPGGGSAGERGMAKEAFNPNASPETQLGIARTAADLIAAKIEAHEAARIRGYGRVVPPSDLYTPETLDTLRKYGSPATVEKLKKYGQGINIEGNTPTGAPPIPAGQQSGAEKAAAKLPQNNTIKFDDWGKK